ncbi:MAG: sigma-70 family RNA polymerase sigma factor [Bacteroidota bacterium]
MTDEELMLKVKQGELKYASVLFDRYHKPIYNFLVKIAFDRELGQDMAQSVFERMIKYRKSYKEGSRFKPWIYQMARNIYADHYRKNKALYSDYKEVEDVATKLSDIDERMVQDEREKLLYISLYKLSTEQRELLMLTRFQQMKYEDVAQVYDISVANVKVKIHRAIKELRNKYLELEKI